MKLVIAVLFTVLLPALAAAQSGVYVQAGPLVDIRFTPSADGDPTLFGLTGVAYEWNDINRDGVWQPGEEGAISDPSFELRQVSTKRAAAGAAAAVGVFVSRSVSLRLEGSVSGGHLTTAQTGAPTRFQSQTSIVRQTATACDITIGAGWHQRPSRRASITYLAGVLFRRERHESTSITSFSALRSITGTLVDASATLEQQFNSTSYSAGVMTGVDVTFVLSRHLAIVPQVRMVAANHDWNLRPAVAMRWRP